MTSHTPQSHATSAKGGRHRPPAIQKWIGDATQAPEIDASDLIIATNPTKDLITISLHLLHMDMYKKKQMDNRHYETQLQYKLMAPYTENNPYFAELAMNLV